MTKKLQVVVIPINMDTIAPKNCIGLLFKNADGVWNIPKNLEDVQKSHQWFANKPYDMIWVDPSAELKVGDRAYNPYNNDTTNVVNMAWVEKYEGELKKVVASTGTAHNVLMINPEDVAAYAECQYDEVEVETEPYDSWDSRKVTHKIKTDSNGYPMRAKGTTIEKSLAALDRAMDKLGKEGIQEIVDSIPDIPGPTFNQYMANLSNSCPIWRKITDAQIGNGVMLIRNNTNGKTMIGNVYQVKDVYMCNQMVCNEYIAMEVILNLPIEE